jgi:1-acylglycerone phosphate reductase
MTILTMRTPTRAVPWAGAYSSSKAALTSLSDTLDMELRPLGVRVTLLEPGLIRTRLSEKINAGEACPKETSLYRPFTASILARTRFVDNTSSVPVDQFAQETVKALLRDNPPRYMSIGGQVRQVHLLQWLPRSWRLDLTWWKFSREK